jgi:putative FmdB family regulatory protein
MPFYEYRCEACGHELEALQKLSDAPLSDCPACGSPSLKKLMSAAGFRLKGGGWYETDFKGGKQKNLHDAGGENKSGAAGNGAKPSGGEKGGEKKAEAPKKADKPSNAAGS